MKIVTPSTIESVAWECELQPIGREDRDQGVPFPSPDIVDKVSKPRVSLGEPVWWPAEQAMEAELGRKWTPPSENRRYTLLRLAFSLHPLNSRHDRYARAILITYLRPRTTSGTVLAHDLYPRRLTADKKGTYSIALGPDLKFADVIDASLGEVGVEIEYRSVFPVVQAYGLGESNPYWRFAHHSADPLLGCQSVYLVLDAPVNADGTRLSVELAATVETRRGPIRFGLPKEMWTHVSRTVGV